MTPETLELLKDLQSQLAVALAWPANEAISSRLNVAIMREEDGLESSEVAALRRAYADLLRHLEDMPGVARAEATSGDCCSARKTFAHVNLDT